MNKKWPQHWFDASFCIQNLLCMRWVVILRCESHSNKYFHDNSQNMNIFLLIMFFWYYVAFYTTQFLEKIKKFANKVIHTNYRNLFLLTYCWYIFFYWTKKLFCFTSFNFFQLLSTFIQFPFQIKPIGRSILQFILQVEHCICAISFFLWFLNSSCLCWQMQTHWLITWHRFTNRL